MSCLRMVWNNGIVEDLLLTSTFITPPHLLVCVKPYDLILNMVRWCWFHVFYGGRMLDEQHMFQFGDSLSVVSNREKLRKDNIFTEWTYRWRDYWKFFEKCHLNISHWRRKYSLGRKHILKWLLKTTGGCMLL